jgi:type I restriction enzyme M protein
MCRSKKPKAHQGTVLFIDAINEVSRQRTFSFLSDENQKKIADAFNTESDVDGFSRRVGINDIAEQNFDLTVHRYVERTVAETGVSVSDAILSFKAAHESLTAEIDALVVKK